jgi:gliding motility-associated-like protein
MTFDNIAIDPCGNVYISFETSSASMSTLASCDPTGYNDNSFNGGNGGFQQDLFISSFSNTGVRLWATYFGGDGNDFRAPITLDVNGNLFIAGEWSKVSSSPSYPVTNPGAGTYYDPTFNGNFDDGFIAKFCSNTCICSSYQGCTVSTVLTVTATSTNPLCNAPCSGTANALATGGCTASTYTFSWSTTPVQTTQTATGLCVGVYTVTVTNASGNTATATVSITQPAAMTATVTSTSAACSGNTGSATVNAGGGSPAYTYNWNPSGQTSQTATGLGAGSYTATVTDASGCTVTNTISVSSSGSITATATSTTICVGGTATLSASGGTTYSWATGATTTSVSFTPTVTTTYSVIVSSGSCSDTVFATVTVSPPPVALASNATICSGQSATLSASGGTGYLWNTTSTNSIINVSPTITSTYSVVVSIGSCLDTAVATVVVDPVPVASAWSNVTITAGNNTTLSASGGTSYVWSNGTSGSSITVNPFVTTIYCVTVTNGTCSDTACVTVFVEPIDCSTAGELYLPNAFSPNEDNENDKIKIYYGNYACIKTFQLFIYNRWGEKVFETTNPLAEWDGSFEGKLEETAVFVYYMKATLIAGGEVIKKGNISLIK